MTGARATPPLARLLLPAARRRRMPADAQARPLPRAARLDLDRRHGARPRLLDRRSVPVRGDPGRDRGDARARAHAAAPPPLARRRGRRAAAGLAPARPLPSAPARAVVAVRPRRLRGVVAR